MKNYKKEREKLVNELCEAQGYGKLYRMWLLSLYEQDFNDVFEQELIEMQQEELENENFLHEIVKDVVEELFSESILVLDFTVDNDGN